MRPNRPTGVTVIAIIGIIYSSLFQLTCPLCIGVGIAAVYPQLDEMAQNDPKAREAKETLDVFINNPTIKTYFIASFAVTVLLGLMLLIGSIGLLKMRPWARTLCIFYALLSVALQIISFIVSLTIVNPEMHKWQQDIMAKKGLPAPPSNPMMEGMMGLGGMVIPIAMSVAILIVLMSRRTSEAFNNPVYDSPDGDRGYDEYDRGYDDDRRYNDDRRYDDDRREEDYDRP